ncbi:MAG: hypothetical protein J6M47_01325 [Clostridia bacterium]|nr:hypothetical protein [Clostridia bacterium]
MEFRFIDAARKRRTTGNRVWADTPPWVQIPDSAPEKSLIRKNRGLFLFLSGVLPWIILLLEYAADMPIAAGLIRL